jgi:hypothetical protein
MPKTAWSPTPSRNAADLRSPNLGVGSRQRIPTRQYFGSAKYRRQAQYARIAEMITAVTALSAWRRLRRHNSSVKSERLKSLVFC